MLSHQQADCCKYREQKRKLALKRLRKISRGPARKIEMRGDCDDGSEFEDQKRKCDKRELNAPPKLSKYRSFVEETMDRIKPSIKNREKYSADWRHIRCFLEANELEQLRGEERTIRAHEHELYDSARRNFGTTRAKKKPQSTQQFEANEKDKKNIGESKDIVVDNQETTHESDFVENKKNSKKKRRSEKNEFWCSELKIKRKKIYSESNDEKEWENYCTDSICSFDSKINLSGLTLSEEEKRNIRENARKKIRSPEQ